MPFIPCHVYKNPLCTSFVLAQEATEETKVSKEYKNMPVSDVFIPESGLHEVTDFYDDVFSASGFTKSGLLTEEEAENYPSPYGDDLPKRLIAEGKASAFYVAPYLKDKYNYYNESRLFILPAEGLNIKPIITTI